jgi:hypothetical protein
MPLHEEVLARTRQSSSGASAFRMRRDAARFGAPARVAARPQAPAVRLRTLHARREGGCVLVGDGSLRARIHGFSAHEHFCMALSRRCRAEPPAVAARIGANPELGARLEGSSLPDTVSRRSLRARTAPRSLFFSRAGPGWPVCQSRRRVTAVHGRCHRAAEGNRRCETRFREYGDRHAALHDAAAETCAWAEEVYQWSPRLGPTPWCSRTDHARI